MAVAVRVSQEVFPHFKQDQIDLRLQILELTPKKPSDKPPLLFVHGAFCAAWVWREYFMPWFAAEGYHCYALSLRGHGESEGKAPINSWSLADYVADVEQVLNGLPERPVLIGHSMGAVVAQKLLEKQDFPAAVLMAPSPPDGLLSPMAQLGFQVPDLLNAFWGGAVAPSSSIAQILFPHQSSARKARYVRTMERVESVRVGLDMSMGDTVVRRKDLNTPVAVIGAANDALVPVSQIRRSASRYGVEPIILPDIGHVMMLDRPWQTAAEATLAGLGQ